MHDSFWTHAGSVDDMNRLLREAFVELHSRPLLQELAAEMQARPPRSAHACHVLHMHLSSKCLNCLGT